MSILNLEDGSSRSRSYVQSEAWDNFFDKEKGVYSLLEVPMDTREFVEYLIQKYKPKMVLDNGCGIGRIKTLFNEMKINCVGTDISYNALRKAIAMNPEYPYFIQAKAHELPFVNERFDMVWFWRVLHNMGRQERILALKEIDRILRPGGVLICAAQSINDPVIQDYMKGHELKEDPNTYSVIKETSEGPTEYKKHFYTEDEIKQQVAEAGLHIIDIREIEEYSGLKEYSGRQQLYWRIEAVKQN